MHKIAFTTCPSQAVANKIAHGLVENCLAACVNVIPKIESFYRWEDKVQQDSEWLLLIKTTSERVADIESYLYDNHPYELPALIAVDAAAGADHYLNWITQSVKG